MSTVENTHRMLIKIQDERERSNFFYIFSQISRIKPTIFHQKNIIKLITHIWLLRHVFSLSRIAVQERFMFQALFDSKERKTLVRKNTAKFPSMSKSFVLAKQKLSWIQPKICRHFGGVKKAICVRKKKPGSFVQSLMIRLVFSRLSVCW